MAKPSALLSTWYSIIATYVEFFFGLVISILVARQLAPDQYGIYGYLMWISALINAVVSGGITLGAIKFIAEAKATHSSNSEFNTNLSKIKQLHRYFQQLLVGKIIYFTLLAGGLIFLVREFNLSAINTEMLYITIIAAMAKSYHMYYVSVLKGFEDFRSLAILSGLITPFNLILVLFCFFTHQPLLSYVWVYLAVSVMYLIISYFLIQKNMQLPQPQIELQKITKPQTLIHKSGLFRHIQAASWIAILNFIVLRQSELFFLNIYSTPDIMAYFNVGFTLANAAMTLVPGIYNPILMPLMARINQSDSLQVEKQLKLSLRYMFQLIIALLFPICYFAADIFAFLYGVQYLNAVFPFQVIITCVGLKSLSDCTNAYLWSQNKQSLMLKLIILGSVVTLSLDYYFIKHYQLPGALLAFSISTLFFVGLNLALVMRKLESTLEWSVYVKTIFSGMIALVIIFPIGHYFPNIGGVIIGSLINIAVYIVMLLITSSLNTTDIDALKRLNQRIFKSNYMDQFLMFIQQRAHV